MTPRTSARQTLPAPASSSAPHILSGLELFIVSDIIHTALSLAFADLLFLGLLVVIRSIVSFFLEREIKDLKEELGE